MPGQKFPRHKISMTPFQPSGQQIVFGVGVDDNERLFRAVMAQGVLRDIKTIRKELSELRVRVGRTNEILSGLAKALKRKLR